MLPRHQSINACSRTANTYAYGKCRIVCNWRRSQNYLLKARHQQKDPVVLWYRTFVRGRGSWIQNVADPRITQRKGHTQNLNRVSKKNEDYLPEETLTGKLIYTQGTVFKNFHSMILYAMMVQRLRRLGGKE